MFDKGPLSPLDRALTALMALYAVALGGRVVTLSDRRDYRAGTWYGNLWLFQLCDRIIFPRLALTFVGLTSWLSRRYRRSPGRRWLSVDRLGYAVTSIMAPLLALVAGCLSLMLWNF